MYEPERIKSAEIELAGAIKSIAAGDCVSWWLVSGQVGRDTNRLKVEI